MCTFLYCEKLQEETIYMNYTNQSNKSIPCRHTKPHTMRSTVWYSLFFPATVFYYELLLRAFDRDTTFFDPALLRSLLFSAATGLLIFLILDLLPWRAAARIAGGRDHRPGW